MPWPLAAITLFLSSVAMYLLVRKGQGTGIPPAWNNAAMFIVPLPIVAFLAITSGQGFTLSLPHMATIGVAAYLFSFLGNIASLKAMETAPNPGYPLIISKSYVVLTSILAVFLFGSELTPRSMAAIGLIVVSSIGITLAGNPPRTPDKVLSTGEKTMDSLPHGKTYKNSNATTVHQTTHGHVHFTMASPWILYSLGAFCAWSALALFSTWILREGVALYSYLFWLLTFVSVIIITSLIRSTESYRPVGNHVIMLIGVGVLSAIFNLFVQIGYTVAPNPGYINAANASSISLLTISSAFLFGDELTLPKLAGVAGVTLGLIILLL